MRCVFFAVLGLLAAPIAPAAVAASGTELRGLAATARSILGADQGVYIEAADGTVLLAQAADKPVHPASVSKVPTTLALLRKLGPEHRFTTTFTAKGRVLDGTLYGDLLVAGDGDPSLVDEDALLVAERLKQAGISRVAGELRLQGPLIFDWKSDTDGMLLRRALSGVTTHAALETVMALESAAQLSPAATDSASLAHGSSDRAASDRAASEGTPGGGEGTPSGDGLHSFGIGFATATTWPVQAARPADTVAGARVIELLGDHPLVVHHSQPLLSLVKSLNDYSNNIFAPFADAAGGVSAVEALARSVLPVEMRSEIILGDGAGADPSNRLSPRAAVKLLRVLEQELASTGHALFDILPVAGVDQGTLRDRLNGPGEAGHVLGKTGTFGDYGASALIGAIPTSDRGTVYFAILDHDVPVPRARQHQDQFVRALLAQLHSVPWNYQPDLRPAIARAQITTSPR